MTEFISSYAAYITAFIGFIIGYLVGVPHGKVAGWKEAEDRTMRIEHDKYWYDILNRFGGKHE
jgi:hypothetical protein